MMIALSKTVFYSKNWYVIRCKTGMEFISAHMLRDIVGLEVFLPEKKLQTSSKGPQTISLFSGYLFIHADLSTVLINDITRSPGVLGFVTFNNQPEAISQTVIDTIYELEARMNEVAPTSTHLLELESRTQMQQNLLKEGFSEPHTASQHMQVLLEILEQDNDAQTSTSPIENIATRTRTRSRRGTRGKGRTIHAKRVS